MYTAMFKANDQAGNRDLLSRYSAVSMQGPSDNDWQETYCDRYVPSMWKNTLATPKRSSDYVFFGLYPKASTARYSEKALVTGFPVVNIHIYQENL